MARAKFQMEVGRLLLGSVRNFLEEAKYDHPELEWREGSGLLSHAFYVSGPADIVRSIYNYLTKKAGLQ